MKFKTPCFVRIKNAGKRKELIVWLENIGYDCSTAHTDEVHYGKTEPVFIVVNGGHCRIQHNRPMLIEEHDCGIDIELFKALAAMNNDNDREQWFVNGLGFWRKASGDTSIGCTLDEHGIKHFFRKASAKKIIEHFKTVHL